MQIDWDHVYLLGYYKNGRAFLTSWDGDYPMVYVIVTGTYPPPLWDAPVPAGAQIHEIPPLKRDQLSRQRMDYAFGWYMKDGFKRRSAQRTTAEPPK